MDSHNMNNMYNYHQGAPIYDNAFQAYTPLYQQQEWNFNFSHDTNTIVLPQYSLQQLPRYTAEANQEPAQFVAPIQLNAVASPRQKWIPNPAIFCGTLAEQRARLRQARIEAVQAVSQSTLSLTKSVTTPESLELHNEQQPTVDLTGDDNEITTPLVVTQKELTPASSEPTASNTRKRTIVDLTGDDNELPNTPESTQQEVTSSPKRPRKAWQINQSTPDWYAPNAPTAEHSAVRPGDLPMTLAARGENEKKERHARASRKALEYRRMATVKPKNPAALREEEKLQQQEQEQQQRYRQEVEEQENNRLDVEEFEALFEDFIAEEIERSEAEEQENNRLDIEEFEALLDDPIAEELDRLEAEKRDSSAIEETYGLYD